MNHMDLMSDITGSFNIRCKDKSRFVMQNNKTQMQILFCMKCGQYVDWSIHSEFYPNSIICVCDSPKIDLFGQLMMEINMRVIKVN
jgi:hypothetical protein